MAFVETLFPPCINTLKYWFEKQRHGQQEPWILIADAPSASHTSRRGVNMLHLNTKIKLFPHYDATSGLLAPLTLLQPSLDAWLTTFSAVMILQYQNHCLLGVGGVQTGAGFILAQLRIFKPRRHLMTKTSTRSVLIRRNLRVAHGEL